MRALCTTSFACLLLCLGPALPARAADVAQLRAILRRAVASPKDQAALQRDLKELEVAIGPKSNNAVGEYVRGWLLSHLGRDAAALAAYDRATVLDPKIGEAWYNGGVILHRLGRTEEAIGHWKRALQVDPKNSDAAYNLGQAYYDRKDLKAALDWWQRARALAPGDFDAAKKVLQVQNALAKWEDAKVTRDAVYRLHRLSTDARVRALKEYCFDQFDEGGTHVYAYETFAPSGAGATLFTFRLTHGRAQVWAVVTVVRPGAEKTLPVRLEVVLHRKPTGEPVLLKTLPDYPALKERIRGIVARLGKPAAK